MKYWLFDGRDAQGPFEPEELKRLPGFTAESLICPDGAASAEQWRPSQFYLVKPPPTKAEPARNRSPASVSKGMGRIAEAGLTDETPPLAAQPQRKPISEKRRISTGAAVAAATAMAAAAGSYLYLNQQKLRPKAAPPVAAAPMAPPAAPTVPALTDAQVQEATAFVQDFKTQSPGRKLPARPADVFSPARWQAARSVGESLAMKGLLPLDAAATAALEKRGEGFKAGERELRKNAKRWAAYADHFLRNAAALGWDVQRSKNCPTQSVATGEPTCFEVAALLRNQRGGPQERHVFVADLTARTLKPLDSNAWLDLDPKGLAAWGKTHIALGEPIDEEALATQSPVYGIPLESHRHVSRHAPIIPPAQQLEDQADQDLGPPTPKEARTSEQAPASPASGGGDGRLAGGDGGRPAQSQDKTDQGLDYTEPNASSPKPQKPAPAAAGSDEQALEKALLEPGPQAANPAPAAQPAPQAAPAGEPSVAPAGSGRGGGGPPAVPPGLDHSVAPAPQAQAQPPAAPTDNSSAKSKSAMDMSVDELKKYLNRDSGTTP